MLQNRFISIGLWASLVMLAILNGMGSSWPINQWSAAYLRGRLDSELAREALPEPPEEHPHAAIWLAEDALDAGEVEEALAFLQPFEDPRNSLVYRMKGKALIFLGDIEAAIKIWAQAKDHQSLIDLAEQAEATGDIETARKAYKAATMVNLKLGTLPFAIFLLNTLNDQGSAEIVLQQALETYHTTQLRITWLRKLGDILEHEERWDEVIAVYKEILARNPKDFKTHIELGWAYYKRGDGFSPASQEINKAIDLASLEGDGYFTMGQVLVEEGRYSEADEWFALAIQRNPEAIGWQMVRANTARTAGNLEKALQFYQETAAHFPNWAPVYFEMAKTHTLVENKQEAIKNIEIAIDLMKPPNIQYYWRAGQIYESAGDDDKALDAYREILLIDPMHVAAENAIQQLKTKLNDK